MKQMKTQKELKFFLQTPEAYSGEFNYKGFGIWWSVYNVVGVQDPSTGYFRCDPGTDEQYLDFSKLEEKQFGGFEWVLS